MQVLRNQLELSSCHVNQQSSEDQIYASFGTCLFLSTRAYFNDRQEEADLYARQCMNFAWAISNRSLKRLSMQVSLAKQAHYAKQLKKARLLYQTALSMFVLTFNAEDLVLSDLLAGLAEMEFVEGNYERAHHFLSWSLKIDGRLLGKEHDQFERKVIQLAWVEYALSLSDQREVSRA